MYAVSAAFQDAVTRSHRYYAACSLLFGGTTIKSSLPIVDGSVQVSRSAAVRRAVDLTVVDVDGTLTPLIGSASGLAPYGAELVVQRGLYLPTGVLEVAPLGVFRVSDAEIVDEGSRTIRVQGSDRSRVIARNQFTDPYVVAAGTDYIAAITALAQDRLPGTAVTNSFGSGGNTPLLVLDVGADPWAELTKMAAAIGAICYFDAGGSFVIDDEPDVLTSPTVWTYAEGANAMILSVDSDLSDDPGYNGVILAAESTTLTAPLRSVVWDNNPSSPTYYLGPYGKVPLFATSAYVSNQSQADSQALLMLQQNLGITEQVQFGSVPNPAHEAGDVVRITRKTIDRTYILDSFEIPLTPDGQMSGTGRRKASAA